MFHEVLPIIKTIFCRKNDIKKYKESMKTKKFEHSLTWNFSLTLTQPQLFLTSMSQGDKKLLFKKTK